jgi:hypothetical protein
MMLGNPDRIEAQRFRSRDLFVCQTIALSRGHLIE